MNEEVAVGVGEGGGIHSLVKPWRGCLRDLTPQGRKQPALVLTTRAQRKLPAVYLRF
jgi:hypothetical protein